LKDSNSIDEKTIFIYFLIIYFSILTIYILYFDCFYENILVANFISFFFVLIFDVFFFKNFFINWFTFSIIWFLVFLISKKIILYQLINYSNEKYNFYQNVNSERQLIEDYEIEILSLNIEKEKESSNLKFDEIFNKFLFNKNFNKEKNLKNNKNKDHFYYNKRNAYENFIIKENFLFYNYHKINNFIIPSKNDEVNQIQLIENKTNFQKFEKAPLICNFYSISNNNSDFDGTKNDFFFSHNLDKTDKFSINKNHRKNKFLKSAINNKKIGFNKVIHNNKRDKSSKHLYLLNHRKFLQILYEVEDLNTNMNAKILKN